MIWHIHMTYMHKYLYIYISYIYIYNIYISIYVLPPQLPTILSPETHFDIGSRKIVLPSPRFRRFSRYKVFTKDFEEASNPIETRDLIDF